MTDRTRAFVAWVAARCYRAYFATFRLQVLRTDGSLIVPRDYPYGREVFALCERDALALGGILTGRRFTVLVAHGRDGDLASAFLAALGCRIVRGSSARGGTGALRALVPLLSQSAEPLGLVVDGPLGPAGRAKPGAVICAIETGRPLGALGAAARHAFVFPRTWSGIYLPLPFTRVAIVLDDMNVHAAAIEDVEPLTEALSGRLANARARAIELASGARW
jgi:lysophospholipid acyltransferase (LPLAT)-like uncharacterized protein